MDEKRIIPCARCKQLLRVPADLKVRATCPKCGYSFLSEPRLRSGSSGEKEPTPIKNTEPPKPAPEPPKKDPLSFLDRMPAVGNAANSAPYVTVFTFRDQPHPYTAFSTDWRCDQDAENTYYNVHCWYRADDLQFHGIRPGSGYTGFQNVNGGHLAIFSMWSIPGCTPTVEYAAQDARVEPFSGEGVGTKILIPFQWEVGRWYNVTVQTRSSGQKTCYDLYLSAEGSEPRRYASVSIPLPNLGLLSDCAFLEDFCYNGLQRADSFRNFLARTADGVTCKPRELILNETSDKYQAVANRSCKCIYRVNKGVLSLAADGKTMARKSMFPANIRWS